MKIIFPLFLLNIVNFNLKNGLQVFLIRNEIAPIVVLEIAFRAGANYENKITDGLFHLYEHMLFKGNRKYKTQKEFRERAKELGIIWNGSTSTERVQYYYICPKENLYPAMELLKESILYPLFDSLELEKEKNVVLDEYRRDFSYPLERFDHALRKEFYGKDLTRKNVLGDTNAIKNATPRILKSIKEKFYVPQNAFLIICGDVDLEKTKKMVRQVWSEWKNRGKRKELPPVNNLKENRVIKITEEGIYNSYMEVLLRGPDTQRERRETYIADLFAKILNSENSFFKKFFIGKDLARNARFGYYTQRYGGEIYFSFETEKEKFAELKEKFFEFIKRIDAPENYPEEQIKKAKREIEVEWKKNKEHPLDYALSLSFFLCTADFSYYIHYLEEINKIEKNDLIEFARKYVKENPMLIGILTPAK